MNILTICANPPVDLLVDVAATPIQSFIDYYFGPSPQRVERLEDMGDVFPLFQPANHVVEGQPFESSFVLGIKGVHKRGLDQGKPLSALVICVVLAYHIRIVGIHSSVERDTTILSCKKENREEFNLSFLQGKYVSQTVFSAEGDIISLAPGRNIPQPDATQLLTSLGTPSWYERKEGADFIRFVGWTPFSTPLFNFVEQDFEKYTERDYLRDLVKSGFTPVLLPDLNKPHQPKFNKYMV